jgi:GR25 family glycosyltransferase involved in LPS biosynthesis
MSAHDDKPAPASSAPHAAREPGGGASQGEAARGADYVGFYINLDGSVERRRRLEAQLAHYRLTSRYRRFAAIDGARIERGSSTSRPAEIGCFHSHAEVVRQNLGSAAHVHVLEDDALLCARTEEVLLTLIRAGAVDAYDIVFADVYLALEIDQFRAIKTLYDDLVREHGPVDAADFAGFTIVDLKNLRFAALASYLVNRASLAKLHELYAAELARGVHLPVDLFIRNLTHAGTIRAGCVFPFITSIHLEDTLATTIADRYDQSAAVAAINALRHAFFIACDWEKCRAVVEQICRPRPLTPHEQLIARVVEYKLFGPYKPF